ncbi:MAG: hypothetical protein BKP49_05365 [Treponema sp. CETP13]|nr:MAG: hypothetical protein BKP49_05365 [Treponema sp. CETP13]
MRTVQKVALSLLLSVFIFAAFTIVAFSGLFSIVETRFYQPSKTETIQKNLEKIALSLDDYTSLYEARFNSFTQLESLATVMNPIQTEQDISNRIEAYGQLITGGTKGLLGIRVVRSDGKHLDYSTFYSDLLKQQSTKIAYNNYTELYINGHLELPYETIQCTQDQSSRIIFDTQNNRILYAYPFYDQNKLYRGTVFFYVKSSDFERYLRDTNVIGITDEYILAGSLEYPAFIKGFEPSLQESMNDFLVKNWDQGILNNVKFKNEGSISTTSTGSTETRSTSDEPAWLLFTNTKSKTGVYISALYSEDIFVFPIAVKIVLLVCVFITGFLGIFLLFNLKQDDMTIIRNRVKRFQFALLSEYVTKNTDDWSKIKQEIESQKQEVNKNVRRSLGHRAKKHSKELDELLDQSWFELISAVSSRAGATTGKQNYVFSEHDTKKASSLDMEEIRSLLEQLISGGKLQMPEKAQVVAESPKKTLEEAEEAGELEEAEEVGELEEAEEASELEEAEAVGEVEEVEEAGEVEELEEAEAVGEVGELEEVEEVGEVSELEEAEEVGELEEAEEASELEEAGEVEELEEAEEVGELEEVGEVSELEEAEEVGELEEAEAVGEVGELEEVEEVGEVEELEEAEEVGELEEAGEVGELEEAGEAEAVDSSLLDNKISDQELSEVLSEETCIGKQNDTLYSLGTEKISSDYLVDFNFKSPDFSDLDDNDQDNAVSFIQDTNNIVTEDVSDVDDVKIFDMLPFSFTINFAGENPLQKMEKFGLTFNYTESGEKIIKGQESTIQEKEGLFTINKNLPLNEVKIDSNFKNLVDSILHKN